MTPVSLRQPGLFASAIMLVVTGAVLALYGPKQWTAPRSAKARPSNSASVAEAPPVQVLVSKTVSPGQVAYRYRVINGSAFPITSVLVGFDYFHSLPELRIFDSDVPSPSATSPNGWHFDIQSTEEDSIGNLVWEVDDPNRGLGGGHQLRGFSTSLPAADSAYETGHWTVYLNAGAVSYYSGLLAVDNQVAVPPSSVEAHLGVHVQPNPARKEVSISFEVPKAGLTTVAVFDANGRFVKEILQTPLFSGVNSASWNGTDRTGARAPAGTYFVRVKTPMTERFARIVWMQ